MLNQITWWDKRQKCSLEESLEKTRVTFIFAVFDIDYSLTKETHFVMTLEQFEKREFPK